MCVPLRVQPSWLPTFFEAVRTLRNLHGLIVTIPGKPAALHLVDEATDRALQVGAVNVVRLGADGRTRGDILDREGLVSGAYGVPVSR